MGEELKMSQINMTKDEREQFLASVHVGVLSIPTGGAPLSAPIWYGYEPGGDLHVVIEAKSRKGGLLNVGTEVSLVAQQEAMPYKYVTVEGTVADISPCSDESVVLALAQRYLGEGMGREYAKSTPLDGSVRVTIRANRWLSVDYGKAPG